MNRNRIPWLFRSLTAVGAVLFLLTLSLFARPAGSSEEMIEVTVWTVTLPDGQVLKVNSVKGQDSPARFKPRSFPYWLTLKAGAIDHAIGTATFELARSTGPDSSFKITQVITSQTIEPFSKTLVSVDVGFDLRVEISEVRKISTSKLRKGSACESPKAAGGGGDCCVTCGGTTACGCGVCMDCGSCCTQGCFCPVC